VTLRRRLTLGVSGVVALVVAIISVIVYFAVRDQVRGQVDQQLARRGDVILQALDNLPAIGTGTAPPVNLPPQLPSPPAGRPFGYVQVVDSTGQPVAIPASPDGAGDQLALPIGERTRRVAAGTAGDYLTDVTVDDQHLRMRVAKLADGRALQMALPLDDADSLLGWLRWATLLIGLGGVGITALISAWVSRSALSPLARLAQAAAEVAQTSDLGRRIDYDRDDEVGRLAATFNEMLRALDRSQTAQRNLVLDASHELRTPLTALRTNIDILADAGEQLEPAERTELLSAASSQLQDLSLLVSDVVELARGAEERGTPERIALDDLVGRCVERARLMAPGVEIRLTAENSTVMGVAPQLERAVGNLLDNALKWNADGTSIDVTVKDGDITVRDHGPGIDAVDLPHVFDRFYRAESSRSLPGSGLGLAIVRHAAEAHGGTVVAEQAAGGGALLRLSLHAEESASRA
jgi:two-component system, OmpR family, sensor histidine kinase MprB